MSGADSTMLTRDEFDVHVRDGTLRLSLIGMSNAGKSYRARILRDELGFLWHHIDELIYRELGFADMSAISSWLGYPSSEGYVERERRYLDLENMFTQRAAQEAHGGNLVFDTTGSVIHLHPETLESLHERSLMVHLDVGEGSLDAMIEKFFVEPKPVAWSGNFHVAPGESEQDALRRSFPALLHKRIAAYRALAHLNVPASEVYDTSAQETLELIRSRLG